MWWPCRRWLACFSFPWCEADKEGRLAWRPRTMKLRYFPADNCDIDALASELVAGGLVVLYGDGLAYVPSFTKHQHINPRESASSLPGPDASPRVVTREHATVTVETRCEHAQVGREGKGRERKESASPNGSRLAADWNRNAVGERRTPRPRPESRG